MSTRSCSKCSGEFPLDCYQRDRQKSSGYRPDCKACCRAKKLLDYAKNKKIHNARSRAWERENRDRINERKRNKVRSDPVLREKLLRKAAEYKQRNPDKMRAKDRAWMENNRGAHVAKGALARARRKRAAPAWLTPEHKARIRQLYDQAASLGCDVDHMCPIAGRDVCGLHVPWNLQLLARRENQIKGNRYVTA